MYKSKLIYRVLIILLLTIFISACTRWTNFTTYFNTFYNAERLIEETEDEFEYYDETKKFANIPRVWVPQSKKFYDRRRSFKTPYFVSDYVIQKDKLQPVRSKLDSVIIKGSKILATKRKSAYIEKTLFLMAQAYFYRNDWLMSQVKCGELIDNYPAGEMSPDAHLLLAKSLLIQTKFQFGKKVLSRTIDIAWQLDRYDILSEAFRLMADVSIYENKIEEAVRPYLQAISQSDDNRLKARWQLEMASIIFKTRQFERSERAFADVYKKYNPDYLRMFEAYLYQASSLNRLGRYDEANEILTYLEEDKKFEEWKAYTQIEKMNQLRLKYENSTDSIPLAKLYMLDNAEKYADTAFVGNKMVYAYYYEKAMYWYKNNDYKKALGLFSNARKSRSPVFNESAKMYKFMQTLYRNQSLLVNEQIYTIKDSTYRHSVAMAAYEVGRTFEKLDKLDSAKAYYEMALEISDDKAFSSAIFMYKLSTFIRKENSFMADSILEVIVDRFPNTDFSLVAAKELGFTDAFLIDSVAELYNSGTNLRKYGDNRFAIRQYLKLVQKFPKSDYAPRALYTIGWLFERQIKNLDSALFYYQILVDKYPKSKYAEEIRLSLLYLISDRTGESVPDSLDQKAKLIPKFEKVVIDEIKKAEPPKEKESNGFGLKDLNPVKLFEKSKEFFNSSVDKVKEPMKLLDSMPNLEDIKIKDFLKPAKDKDNRDSTKTAKPDTTKTK